MSKIGKGPKENLELGDLYILDSGELGFELMSKGNPDKKESDKKISFLNQGGELALLEWLKEKYPQGRSSTNVSQGYKNGKKRSFDTVKRRIV